MSKGPEKGYESKPELMVEQITFSQLIPALLKATNNTLNNRKLPIVGNGL